MSRRADGERLKVIQEAILRMESYVSGMSYEDFLDDSKTQDAVIRNIVEVFPQPNYILTIVADDGRIGRFDVGPYLKYRDSRTYTGPVSSQG